MGYDSFEGGTHSVHEWVPVGFGWIPVFTDGGPTPSAGYAICERNDRTFVVRACRLCPEIWVQEFDFGAKIAPKALSRGPLKEGKA